MKVLVCGGRHYADVPSIWIALDALPDVRMIIEGASDDVTGGYVGADYWAHQWALARNVSTVRAHAAWVAEGRKAGPLRNQRMLDEHKPDLVVAFPGNRGTADMVRRARARGIKVEFPMGER